MNKSFDRSDEGKRVVTTAGDVVGTVLEIERGVAHVRPEPDLFDGYGSWISSYWDPEGAYELDREAVRAVTGNRVVIDSATDTPSKMRQQVATE